MSFISELLNEDFYISSWKHKNPIPPNLKECTTHEFELVLRLASESLVALRDSTSSIQFQNILDKKQNVAESEKKDLENRYIKEIQLQKDTYTYNIDNLDKKLNHEKNELQNRYIKEIQQLKDTHAYNLEHTKKQYSATLVDLEQSKFSAEKSYQLLQQNFLSLQNSMNSNIEKTVVSSIDKQNQYYTAQAHMLEKHYTSQIETLQRSLEQYQQLYAKEQNSSLKGKQGETNFDNMVQKYTTWELHDTSKIPDSCDRLATIRGCKTLFEIKNYSYNIPKKEIDKFKRDLELHKDCPFGIFISLNTAIIGANQDFIYAELNSNNQLLIYIQRFLDHDPESIFSVLNTFVDVAHELYNKSINFATDSSLQSKIDSLKPIITSEITCIAKVLNELVLHKNFLIDSITKQHSSIKHSVEKIRFTFESIFRLLFLENSVGETCNSTEDNKKKKRKKKAEVQETNIVLETTSACEPSHSYE